MYKVLSEDDCKFVVNILKSVTFNELVGKFPEAIPATLVTASIVIWDEPTLTTFAKFISILGELLNCTRLFFFTIFPGNAGFVLLTVLMPPELALIVTIPTLNFVDWIVFALKVDPRPTTPLSVPKTDFTSEIEYSVTAIAILPSDIPLNMSDSFAKNFPEVS